MSILGNYSPGQANFQFVTLRFYVKSNLATFGHYLKREHQLRFHVISVFFSVHSSIMSLCSNGRFWSISPLLPILMVKIFVIHMIAWNLPTSDIYQIWKELKSSRFDARALKSERLAFQSCLNTYILFRYLIRVDWRRERNQVRSKKINLDVEEEANRGRQRPNISFCTLPDYQVAPPITFFN